MDEVRRFECKLPIGEVLPGEDFAIGIRIVAPAAGVPLSGLAFYCLPGGHMNLVYFDLGSQEDRRFSFAQAMAERGHVTVLADHPGIGESTRPHDEFALTVDLLAEAHARAARVAVEGLRAGTLMPGLEAMPQVVPIGCGHSMGAVVMIDQQALDPLFSGIVLLGYGRGGLPDMLPPEAVEKADDPDWLRDYLQQLVRERFGTAIQEPAAARATKRGREKGSPSFHAENADPDGRIALRAAVGPLLALPGLFSMFPGASDRPSAAIAVPVLVVTGTHDFIEAGDSLRDQFARSPDLSIVRPRDTGHNLFIFPSRAESYEAISGWATKLRETIEANVP